MSNIVSSVFDYVDTSPYRIVLILVYIMVLIVAAEIFAYLWHRWAHTVYSGPIHNTHQVHHTNEEDVADNDFGWIVLLLLFITGGLGLLWWVGVPQFWCLITGLTAIIVLTVNWYVHRSYHCPDSYLRQYSWFQRWTLDHYVHHSNPEKHYGIVSCWGDRLGGTWSLCEGKRDETEERLI